MIGMKNNTIVYISSKIGYNIKNVTVKNIGIEQLQKM